MADLASVARIPNVASAVLGDAAGGFHDAIREQDGESVASVSAFVTTSLAVAGEELGLGALRRVAVAGGKGALLVSAAGGALVTARVEPAAALAAVERALDASLGTGG
jgi:predicted regulator of Ras-like GTPase activity (Roadblock/LC7/MglB family)